MRKESFNNFDKPTYDLDKLQKLIGNAATIDITRQSLRDAEMIDYSATEIIAVVLSLKQNEFYKTMPSNVIPELWQDVYKPLRHGMILYVKLQKSFDNKGVVISFKRADENDYA